MKKFAKILPYLIIVFCVAFIFFTLVKVDERADALTAQVEAMIAENTALQTENAKLAAALNDADDLLAVKEAELAETTARLDAAEATLTEVLATVQAIRSELNAQPAGEVPEDEVPAAPAEEMEAAIPSEETAPEASGEEAAAEVPAEEVTEEAAPAEEVESAEEVPAE